jgi:hypothetical protein
MAACNGLAIAAATANDPAEATNSRRDLIGMKYLPSLTIFRSACCGRRDHNRNRAGTLYGFPTAQQKREAKRPGGARALSGPRPP